VIAVRNTLGLTRVLSLQQAQPGSGCGAIGFAQRCSLVAAGRCNTFEARGSTLPIQNFAAEATQHIGENAAVTDKVDGDS